MELLQLAAVMVLVFVVPMAVLTAVAARAARRSRAVLEAVTRDHHLAGGVFPVRWKLDPDGEPVDGLATPRQAVRSLGYEPWTRFEGADTGMSERVEGELYRNEDATIVIEIARAWPNDATILTDPRVTSLADAVQEAIAKLVQPTTEPTTVCTFTSFVADDDGMTIRLATSNAGGPPLEHPTFRVANREDMTPISLAKLHQVEIGGRATEPIPDDPAAFLDGEQALLAEFLEARGWLGRADAHGRRHFTEAHWEMVRERALG